MQRRLHKQRLSVINLAPRARIGEATLFRMKNSKDFFVARSVSRDRLAFDLEGKKLLGYFGYPPILDTFPLDKGNNNTESAGVSREERQSLIRDDYFKTLLSCDWILGDCHLCKSGPNVFEEHFNIESLERNDSSKTICEVVAWKKNQQRYNSLDNYTRFLESLDVDKFTLKNDNGKSQKGINNNVVKKLYLSTHISKQYGAIRPKKARTFDLELHVCSDCLIKHEYLFQLGIPDLISCSMEHHDLNQKQLADELGVKGGQGLISKLKNFGARTVSQSNIEFISSKLLRRLIGITHYGPKSNPALYSLISKRSFYDLMDDLASAGFKESNYVYDDEIIISATRTIIPIDSKKLDWNGEHSLKIKCDLSVTSSDGEIKIVCFFSPIMDPRVLSLLIANATNFDATHVCFLSEELISGVSPYSDIKYLCLNICKGTPQTCTIPWAEAPSLHQLLISDGDPSLFLEEFLNQRASLKKADTHDDDFLSIHFGQHKFILTVDEFGEHIENDTLNESYLQLFYPSYQNYKNEKISTFQRNLLLPVINGECTTTDIADRFCLDEMIIETLFSTWSPFL